jgi:hypothetical protein
VLRLGPNAKEPGADCLTLESGLREDKVRGALAVGRILRRLDSEGMPVAALRMFENERGVRCTAAHRTAIEKAAMRSKRVWIAAANQRAPKRIQRLLAREPFDVFDQLLIDFATSACWLASGKCPPRVVTLPKHTIRVVEPI